MTINGLCRHNSDRVALAIAATSGIGGVVLGILGTIAQEQGPARIVAWGCAGAFIVVAVAITAFRCAAKPVDGVSDSEQGDSSPVALLLAEIPKQQLLPPLRSEYYLAPHSNDRKQLLHKGRLQAHGVSDEKAGLYGFLDIILEGELQPGTHTGPLGPGGNPQVFSGDHGPYYILLDDESCIGYLVPSPEIKKSVEFVLNQAQMKGMISSEELIDYSRSLMTYEEFCALTEEDEKITLQIFKAHLDI